MDLWLQLAALGLIQGLTEFLPVSSSGHLVVFQGVFEQLGGVQSGAEKLFVDVMLHVGTVVAIAVFYRRTIGRAVLGLLGRHSSKSRATPDDSESDRKTDPDEIYTPRTLVRAGVLTVLATIPAVIVGLTLKDQLQRIFDQPLVAAGCFLVTATLLILTTVLQRGREGTKTVESMLYRDALLIGFAQCLAILPGISRSGLTIVAALLLGLRREWAVGFSLLMAVPAILGAAVLELRDLDAEAFPVELVTATTLGALTAAIVGYLAIAWRVQIVRRGRLWYFSVYLIIMSVVAAAYFSGRESGPERPALGGTVDAADPERITKPGLDRSAGVAGDDAIGPERGESKNDETP